MKFSNLRHLAIASIATLSVAACGDLSPAKPSLIEQEPVLTILPIDPVLFNGSILYRVHASVQNPRFATGNITLTRLEFTLFGADGSIYWTGEDPIYLYGSAAIVQPGLSGGGNGTFSDPNTTRPLATVCMVRARFTRADGSTWMIEERSTIRRLLVV